VYDSPGNQRPTIPSNLTISFTDSNVGILTIPAGTSGGSSYQISSDTLSTINAYWIQNNLGQEMYYAPNDWDWYSLGDTARTSYITPDATQLDEPITYMYVYLKDDQVSDGTIEFGFFGDP